MKSLIASVSHLSPSRKQAVVAVLSGIFESAVDDEIVKANPCNKAGKYCGNGCQADINPLTTEEVQSLLEKTPARSPQSCIYPRQIWTLVSRGA